MPELRFQAPLIDREAASFGDREHVTGDGSVMTWDEMHLRHLMAVASNKQAWLEEADDGRRDGWEILNWVTGEHASWDIERQLLRLEEDISEGNAELRDLRRYIRYRKSIGKVWP